MNMKLITPHLHRLNSRAIWITWESQRRNRELAKAFEVKLYELKEIDTIKNIFRKYLTGIIKTYFIVIKEKPVIIFCQNPSLVLSFFLIFLNFFLNRKLIVDAHNAGLFPAEGKSEFLNIISRLILKKSHITLVTNDGLKQFVEKNGGRAFILPDKIPELAKKEIISLKGAFNMLFICSYAKDEPYDEVFKAAANIDSDICIYVTGNYKKKTFSVSELPSNVILTGYLLEEEYIAMLQSVDATIDLTSRDDCLVCGAYESVAAGKPMVLSDTKALRAYFRMGAVYTRHSVQELTTAMEEVIRRKDELGQEVLKLKGLLQTEWIETKQHLQKFVKEMGGTA